jgi:hypothetical protein
MSGSSRDKRGIGNRTKQKGNQMRKKLKFGSSKPANGMGLSGIPSTLTADEARKMEAIAVRAGFPLESEDGAAGVIAQIRAQIPHVQDAAIGTLFEWIRILRETRGRTTDHEWPPEDMSCEEWLAIRKDEGRKIDPSTAEVRCRYVEVGDPYGVCSTDLSEVCDYLGPTYFARRPGSEVWVCFDDLPDKTRDALWERHKSKLAGLWLTRKTEVHH